MKSFLVSVPILLLLGCGLFEENESDKPEFIGEWRSTAQFVYTLGDSLYRDSLERYMLARGLDMDSLFSSGPLGSLDRAKFDSLVQEYAWKCPDGIACGDTLWSRTNTRRFTADSVFNLIYLNGVVSESYAGRYTYTEDSLFYDVSPDFRIEASYEFKPGGDTLILYGIPSLTFGLADTLVRLD